MLSGLRYYTCPFSAISVSAAQDLFEVNSASGKLTWITGINLSQYSDFGDAQDELLSLVWVLGFTTSGSGGGTITPAPAGGDAAYSGTIERNNTTQANTGTTTTLRADAWNVRAGYVMHWDPTKWLLVPSGGRVVLQQTVPADAITMNGTLHIAEAG